MACYRPFLSARPRKYRDVFPLRGNGHSRRLAGSFRVMSLRDPRPPLRGPRAASLALDNLSKVASGLAPCLPQKSLGHTSAYFRNRAPSARPRKYRDVFPLRGYGHSRRLAGSFRVMSLRDPRSPLRGPRAASLALDNLSKVASGLAPCLPQKSLGHTSAYFRNRAPSARPRKYRDVFPLRGYGHSRRLAGSFRVMSLRDPRSPLRGPRAASLALDNLSKVASGLAPCLPQKSLGHTSAYFRNRAPSARPRKYRDVFPLRGYGHSRRLAGSFRVMSLRDPRSPLRGPRAASLALDNLSKVASGLAPCLPQKSLGHTSAYFRNRAPSARPR